MREADIAVDFVPDELESKLEIFSMIDRMAPPKTILCTPSVALSITDLASCVYRPDRCVAMRGELVKARHGTGSLSSGGGPDGSPFRPDLLRIIWASLPIPMLGSRYFGSY